MSGEKVKGIPSLREKLMWDVLLEITVNNIQYMVRLLKMFFVTFFFFLRKIKSLFISGLYYSLM